MLLTVAVCPDAVILSSHIYVVIICSIINTTSIICVKLKSVPVFVGLFVSVLIFNLFLWSVPKFVICNVRYFYLSSRLILIAIIRPIEKGCRREWEWDRVAIRVGFSLTLLLLRRSVKLCISLSGADCFCDLWNDTLLQ